VLLDSIVNNLLNCLNDPSPVVRQLCLKGLASLSQLSQEQVKFLLYLKSLGTFSEWTVADVQILQN
jgi:vesicle coat complex subunit